MTIILTTSKVIFEQGGNDNNAQFGLRAKLAMGLAILGCAATLAFGGAQSGETFRSQPQLHIQAAQPAAILLNWEHQERALVALGGMQQPLDISISGEFGWAYGGFSSPLTTACICADVFGVTGEGCARRKRTRPRR